MSLLPYTKPIARPSLPQLLQESPYQTYVYSYPHKTTYRTLDPPIPLADLWSTENKNALFLYIHIPFCEMRCGFCNLFTTVTSDRNFIREYVATVHRQAIQVKAALGECNFARLAIGGGTPTQLPLSELTAILEIAETTMGANLQQIPGSVEVSPDTVDNDKLKLLHDRGIDRISIGVQSFIDSEVLAIARHQNRDRVLAALSLIRSYDFPTLNIDLMYGLPHQTVSSWLYSLREALQFQPEELYLYPLYVRPLTGLDKTQREWDDIRLACYREGRSLLLSEGYTQISMRMFRADRASSTNRPVYCCQADGMVGLGCGARSYTDSLHYSTHYAVSNPQIRNILQAFIQSSDRDFTVANYGFPLDAEDRRRRYLLLSLLSEDGLNLNDYRDRFATDPFADFPELRELLTENLAICDRQLLHLTPTGIEVSDAIGMWLFSDRVRHLMQSYDLK